MNHDVKQLRSLLRAHDPAAGVRADPSELAAHARRIMAASGPQPAPRRRTWKPVVLTVALGTVIAVAALGVAVWPRPAAALEFARSGEDYIVTVKDVYASPEQYAEEFRARGLPVTLELEPVSPSLVGKVVGGHGTSAEEATPQIEPIPDPGCPAFEDPCTVRLRIPADLAGPAGVILGRPARDGENYATTGEISAPGEVLHCVPYLRMTVGQLRGELAKRGMDIDSFRVGAKREVRRDVPDGWWPSGVLLSGRTKVVIYAGPEQAEVSSWYRDAQAGCADGG
ncbi:hypothetical protein [Nonomuraea gerenzanensis]|uniref:Uncharacterized protein n=1 Tax=Nonomuraea gerenzanensis TaxID=93944 RepID=A0A1M4DX41_9ACTN|nr:hypothetical protein [Nonomuraea gerenzanensis]UBU13492.1 hypothetical protein LCN96_00175 [Nonomuraea gerenzanensis]SBO91153.1 hypothetical protein BN4615_P667 [Nonomuraea gerenzanensis]